MYASHEEIGAVGGRLLFQDGRLQHAGIIFPHGLPGHVYRDYAGDFRGYSNNVVVAQNYLAVTGACLMTPRDLFERVGGMAAEFPINYNDVDYCLKVHAAGRRVVYDPDTVLYHFESSSRDSDVEEWERELLVERWGALDEIDPSVNPNMNHGSPRLLGALNWARRRSPLSLLSH
jgi:GT2 family glycosyltransferase